MKSVKDSKPISYKVLFFYPALVILYLIYVINTPEKCTGFLNIFCPISRIFLMPIAIFIVLFSLIYSINNFSYIRDYFSKFFNYSYRSSRKELWSILFFSILLQVLVNTFLSALDILNSEIIFLFYYFFVLLPLPVILRRIRDLGWGNIYFYLYIFSTVLPEILSFLASSDFSFSETLLWSDYPILSIYLSYLLLLPLLILKGENKPNKFGPPINEAKK